MSIVSITKRARAGTLEVEHLLREASYPNEALADVLDALSVALEWQPSRRLDNGHLTLPLQTWATVVSTYCREGFSGLVRLSSDRALASYVIGLLEELKTKEALDTLLLAFKESMATPIRDGDIADRVASAVNIMLSFKPAVAADPQQAMALQAFLFALYGCAARDAERATALLALRGIGDEDAAEFAASKCLSSPWHDVPGIVARHIRKRLRGKAN